jgi:hypothetical protein
MPEGQSMVSKQLDGIMGGGHGGNVARTLLHCILTCAAGVAAVLMSWSATAAEDKATELAVVWSFANDEIVYPCYDQTFAIIYFKYDRARNVTSIWKKELNGDERVIAEFPGVREMRSLSCSQDGKTIAAVAEVDINNSEKVIFLLRGDDKALYKIPHYWPFSRTGTYTLLSPDGETIALPEVPTLISGIDLLRDIKLLVSQYNLFFIGHYAYKNDDKDIVKYEYVDDRWKERSRQVVRPSGYDATEIARCGDHDVASLMGVDDSREMVLGEKSPSQQDWLGRIGVRKLFDKYEQPTVITSSHGACAFLLRPLHTHRLKATGLARFDSNGVQVYSLPYGGIRAGQDDVYFSKDGCYVLLQGGWSPPGVPGNIHLLAVKSPRCG